MAKTSARLPLKAVECQVVLEGWRVLKSYLKAGDVARYIRFETSVIETQVHDLGETRTIRSLLHTRGKPEWAEEHPEIGGFELPCMRPSWIAVNKFDALHRRALDRDFKGITARGRDLYDLWSVAGLPTRCRRRDTRAHS